MSGYFLSLDADEDLQDIYDFSAGVWGERQARSYLTDLYEVFDRIGHNPGIGRRRAELGEGIRSLSHGSHLVLYMAWDGDVAIVRVLHGARDLESLLDTYDPRPGIERKRPHGE